MPVNSDFELKYSLSDDPWKAGDATGAYYESLLTLISRHKAHIHNALDLGCGNGAFTSRLSTMCDVVCGMDLSSTAVAKAAAEYPTIRFFAEDIRYLDRLNLAEGSFDFILCSQVLYYLTRSEAADVLAKVEKYLTADGILCLAHNCSGGAYYLPDEFRSLVEERFEILEDQSFDHHLFVMAAKRPCQVAITIDYEVKDPKENLDRNVSLDAEAWRSQVIRPCNELMGRCEQFGALITIMFEIGQYWFLELHLPSVAQEIRQQLIEAVHRGHDVQLHLHPRWLPEWAAQAEPDGSIRFNLARSRLHDMPVSMLEDLLSRAKRELEDLLRPERDSYRAIVFRAGKYQIQPHHEIFGALETAGFLADSSVWHGGFLSSFDQKPGFDFRSLWHPYRPYRPGQSDINVPAPPGSDAPRIVELPILALNGQQWCADSLSSEQMLKLWQTSKASGGPRLMIGHTKTLTPARLATLDKVLESLQQDSLVKFSRLQDIVESCRERCLTDTAAQAATSYLKRSYASPAELWDKLSPYGKNKLKLFAKHILEAAKGQTTVRVLDVGCGTGELVTLPLSHLLQAEGNTNVEIHATDVDSGSIARACEIVNVHSVRNVTFECAQVEQLKDVYDIVLCSEVLEHLQDPARLLSAIHPRVAQNGLLLVSSPNGYGYGEIERRLLYRAFGTLKRLPPGAGELSLAAYRRLRAWLRPMVKADDDITTNGAGVQVFGTLNFANDIHVRFFTIRNLRGLLRAAGFRVQAVVPTQLLGGLIGSLAEKRINSDRLMRKLPIWMVDHWVLICRNDTPADA